MNTPVPCTTQHRAAYQLALRLRNQAFVYDSYALESRASAESASRNSVKGDWYTQEEDDLDRAACLIARADAVIESIPPAVFDALEIGYIASVLDWEDGDDLPDLPPARSSEHRFDDFPF